MPRRIPYTLHHVIYTLYADAQANHDESVLHAEGLPGASGGAECGAGGAGVWHQRHRRLGGAPADDTHR